MPPVLPEIVANKRAEVSERRAVVPLARLEAQAAAASGRFAAALAGGDLKLVTEIKPSSPSAGVLTEKLDLDLVLAAYDRDADAISVLTDSKYFGGSLALLSQVASRSMRPALCKDFVLDPYQVYEARLAGAEAVLLIVKVLDDETLAALAPLVRDLGMTPVIEIQTDEELARALAVGPECLLINNRDLTDFTIDLATSERLAVKIPPAVLTISASGILCRADIERLLPVCSRFLVGSALMQAGDLPAKLKELRGR